LQPLEALSSHVLPVNEKMAKDSSTPMLQLGKASNSAQTRMAGNAMSVPCIGSVLLCAALGLEKIPKTAA